MKQTIYHLLVLLLVAAGLQACKTNEKNMSDAYQRAISGATDKDNPDDLVYTSIRREMQHTPTVVDGDTIDVNSQWVRVTEGGGGINESLKKYCVVVGGFKQIFNARSMRERLVENGYPSSFVVETREPYYYVVAASYSDLAQARQLLGQVATDKNFVFKAPMPFILRPSQIR